jgi:S-methylmethionine-dependent homocysteine/selenocysteine methylase
MADEYTNDTNSNRRNATNLRSTIAGRSVRVLDGATGTELERRGVDLSLPLWSARALIDAPDVVREIHRDHVLAGAHFVTANTFRTQRRTLERAGIARRDRELCDRAVQLARQAVREATAAEHRTVWVLGSAAPLEDCYRPDLVPPDDALEREHARHCDNLATAGVDAILIETIGTCRELAQVAAAARRTGLPMLISLIPAAPDGTPEPKLLSGEPLERAVECALEHDPIALLVNCIPARQVDSCLDTLAASGLAHGAFANLGTPDPEPAQGSEPHYSDALAPDDFAGVARGWLARGATLIGGCCGTRPEHTGALAREVAPRRSR